MARLGPVPIIGYMALPIPLRLEILLAARPSFAEPFAEFSRSLKSSWQVFSGLQPYFQNLVNTVDARLVWVCHSL